MCRQRRGGRGMLGAIKSVSGTLDPIQIAPVCSGTLSQEITVDYECDVEAE